MWRTCISFKGELTKGWLLFIFRIASGIVFSPSQTMRSQSEMAWAMKGWLLVVYIDDCIVYLSPVDHAVPIGHGQGHEGRLQGHVPDECQNEPTTAAEDHDGV